MAFLLSSLESNKPKMPLILPETSNSLRTHVVFILFAIHHENQNT